MNRLRREALAARAPEILLAAAGLVLLGWCATSSLASAAYQSAAARALAEARRHGGASGGSRVPFGRIEIPAARISAMVAEGVDGGTLERAVGHVPGSALPGDPGHVVLAGHRDTFFRGLGTLRRGDLIRVTTPEGEYRYRVADTRIVSPRAVATLTQGPAPGITLVTCYPFHVIGPAPRRYIVHAAAVGGEPDGGGP
jgi:sortase A